MLLVWKKKRQIRGVKKSCSLWKLAWKKMKVKFFLKRPRLRSVTNQVLLWSQRTVSCSERLYSVSQTLALLNQGSLDFPALSISLDLVFPSKQEVQYVPSPPIPCMDCFLRPPYRFGGGGNQRVGRRKEVKMGIFSFYVTEVLHFNMVISCSVTVLLFGQSHCKWPWNAFQHNDCF